MASDDACPAMPVVIASAAGTYFILLSENSVQFT